MANAIYESLRMMSMTFYRGPSGGLAGSSGFAASSSARSGRIAAATQTRAFIKAVNKYNRSP